MDVLHLLEGRADDSTVLYNGEAEWLAPQELAELIERVDETTEAYVPRLRYRVIDGASL